MTENYKEYIDSLIDEYPNAEKAFAYFCEQSHYDNMSEFLDDYGWNIEGLEEYVDVTDYKLGMDNLYSDTILKKRKQRGFIVKMC